MANKELRGCLLWDCGIEERDDQYVTMMGGAQIELAGARDELGLGEEGKFDGRELAQRGSRR